MENASKALLIAGSVLIAIVLIGVGVNIFNSTQGTADAVKVTMDSTQVAAFNNKFLGYSGSNRSAAQVRALANVVIAHNAVEEQLQVSFAGNFDANDIMDSISNLDTSKRYKIEMFDNENDNGLIDTITFSEMEN